MNYRQVEAVLSDLLMKCEEKGVALPVEALAAVDAALEALQSEGKHELGRPQIEAAVERLVERFGVKQDHVKLVSFDIDAPQRKRRAPSHESKGRKKSSTPKTQSVAERITADSSISPKGKRKQPKHKLLREIEERRAVCEDNQPLVEQLAQLGEYELRTGYTQRGVTRLRAARGIRDAHEVIKSGAQARTLDGIGPSAAAKVDAILHAGIDGALREYRD
ncbi:hypothetical protein PINS_up008135 [Pythium insidiosum]|nr:hypothetical protein PINS_up008135 [Pythium insidiosum]